MAKRKRSGSSRVTRPKLTRSKPVGRGGQRTVVNTPQMLMSGSQGMGY